MNMLAVARTINIIICVSIIFPLIESIVYSAVASPLLFQAVTCGATPYSIFVRSSYVPQSFECVLYICGVPKRTARATIVIRTTQLRIVNSACIRTSLVRAASLPHTNRYLHAACHGRAGAGTRTKTQSGIQLLGTTMRVKFYSAARSRGYNKVLNLCTRCISSMQRLDSMPVVLACRSGARQRLKLGA